MDVIDRIRRMTKYLNQQGIEIRYEDLNGAPSGLCRINGKQLLMIEMTLSSGEQLRLLEESAATVKPTTARSVA